jgi:hypothetical protein
MDVYFCLQRSRASDLAQSAAWSAANAFCGVHAKSPRQISTGVHGREGREDVPIVAASWFETPPSCGAHASVSQLDSTGQERQHEK